MQLSTKEIEMFRSIGYSGVVFEISMSTVDHELIWNSYKEYLWSIVHSSEKAGEKIVTELIPSALASEQLTVLLASAFAFSFFQPEFDDQNPRAFLEFVRSEILKLLESEHAE